MQDTSDPVLTPSMMDDFVNQRTQVFAGLDQRQRRLLRSVYHPARFAEVTPLQPGSAALRHSTTGAPMPT